MKKTISFLVCTAIIGLAGSAHAYMYELGAGSDVTGDALSDPGLVMQYEINSALDGYSFDLNPGDSETFHFATFWTNEGSLNWDDTQAQSITAGIDFDMPDLTASVDGQSDGYSYFFGVIQGWEIDWEDAKDVTFGYMNSGSFTIELNDVSQAGWFGLPSGYEAKVYATVTHNADPVPEPGTILLFGAGLASLVGVRRNKK